jgi:hypothetical protein
MKITDVTTTQLFCPQNNPAQVFTASTSRSQASERGRLIVHTCTDEALEPNPAAVEQGAA